MKRAVSGLGSSFACANVYIGALVGPALVAGTYAVVFFLPDGCNALWTPFIACGVVGLLCACAAEIIREFKTYEYGAAAKRIYFGNRILRGIFELYVLLSNVVGCAIVQSMSGTFVHELFGLPHISGMILIGLISLVIIYFRDGAIRILNSVMSVIMLVGFIIISITVIALYRNELGNILIDWYVPETSTLKASVSNLATFAFGSSAFAITLCCVEQPIKTKKQSVWIGIFTMLLGGFMMALSCFTFLPFLQEISGNSVPLIYVMDHYLSNTFPWMPIVYYVIMLLAIISSVVPGAYMISSRWQTLLPNRGFFECSSREKSDNRKNMLVAVIYIVVCSAISLLGLDTVLNVGLTLIGYIGIPLVVIPLVFIWPVKLYRIRKIQQCDCPLTAAKQMLGKCEL